MRAMSVLALETVSSVRVYATLSAALQISPKSRAIQLSHALACTPASASRNAPKGSNRNLDHRERLALSCAADRGTR